MVILQYRENKLNTSSKKSDHERSAESIKITIKIREYVAKLIGTLTMSNIHKNKH